MNKLKKASDQFSVNSSRHFSSDCFCQDEIRQLKENLRLKAEASKLRAQQARQAAMGSSTGASQPQRQNPSPLRDPPPPRDSPPPRESYAPQKTKIDRARFAAGDVLSVTGLKNRPELNGKLALVVDVKPPADAEERSRYGVLVDGTRFLLKEGSLKRTPRGSSAAKKGYGLGSNLSTGA